MKDLFNTIGAFIIYVLLPGAIFMAIGFLLAYV